VSEQVISNLCGGVIGDNGPRGFDYVGPRTIRFDCAVELFVVAARSKIIADECYQPRSLSRLGTFLIQIDDVFDGEQVAEAIKLQDWAQSNYLV